MTAGASRSHEFSGRPPATGEPAAGGSSGMRSTGVALRSPIASPARATAHRLSGVPAGRIGLQTRGLPVTDGGPLGRLVRGATGVRPPERRPGSPASPGSSGSARSPGSAAAATPWAPNRLGGGPSEVLMFEGAGHPLELVAGQTIPAGDLAPRGDSPSDPLRDGRGFGVT